RSTASCLAPLATLASLAPGLNAGSGSSARPVRSGTSSPSKLRKEEPTMTTIDRRLDHLDRHVPPAPIACDVCRDWPPTRTCRGDVCDYPATCPACGRHPFALTVRLDRVPAATE